MNEHTYGYPQKTKPTHTFIYKMKIKMRYQELKM